MEGIRYVIANVQHKTVIHNFLLEHFRVEEPITAAIDTTAEAAFDFFVDLTMAGLNAPVSILAFDDNTGELVGCCLNEITIVAPGHTYEPEVSAYKFAQPNRICEFIDACNVSRSCGGCNGQVDIYDHFPTSRRMYKVGVISVHAQYFKRGIGSTMLRRSIQLAHFLCCDSVTTTATALRSQLLFAKHGLLTKHQVAYAHYEHEGEVVFKHLHDGATHGKLMGFEITDAASDNADI